MNPNKYVVNRKLNKEIEKILNQMGRMLDEIVNFGSHILDFCQEEQRFNEVYSPIPSSFSQFLSMLDGTSIIVKKGNGDSLKPILRGLFEIGLTLEYLITEEPKKGVLAYQVAHAHKRIKSWKKLDSNNQEGKDFKLKIEKSGVPFPIVGDTKDRINNLNNMLKKEEYKEVNDEWEQIKRNNRGREPQWYSLFGGPKNIYELAEYFDKEAVYEVFYRNLSTYLHGSGSLERMRVIDSSRAVMPGVRTVDEIPVLVTMTSFFALDIFRKMLSIFNGSKLIDYAKWYKDNISKDFLEISHMNIKVNYEIQD